MLIYKGNVLDGLSRKRAMESYLVGLLTLDSAMTGWIEKNLSLDE